MANHNNSYLYNYQCKNNKSWVINQKNGKDRGWIKYNNCSSKRPENCRPEWPYWDDHVKKWYMDQQIDFSTNSTARPIWTNNAERTHGLFRCTSGSGGWTMFLTVPVIFGVLLIIGITIWLLARYRHWLTKYWNIDRYWNPHRRGPVDDGGSCGDEMELLVLNGNDGGSFGGDDGGFGGDTVPFTPLYPYYPPIAELEEELETKHQLCSTYKFKTNSEIRSLENNSEVLQNETNSLKESQVNLNFQQEDINIPLNEVDKTLNEINKSGSANIDFLELDKQHGNRNVMTSRTAPVKCIHDEEKSSSKFNNTKITRKITIPRPFSFEKRNKEALENKQQKIAEYLKTPQWR